MSMKPARLLRRTVGLTDSPALIRWRPTMVSGLQWWLAADHISGVAAGGAVAAWNDSSGNGYNLTQGTGSAQPTWQVNVINNQPVVRFDGSDYLDAGNVFTINDTLTLIVVYSANSISARMTILGQENTANAFMFEVNDPGTGTTAIHGGFGTLINGTFVSNTQGGRHPITTPIIQAYTRNGAGATHALYEFGSSMTLAVNATNSYSADGNKIIGRRAAASQFFTGDLAELILWNTLLGASDLNRAFIYLSRKYGLLNAARLDY